MSEGYKRVKVNGRHTREHIVVVERVLGHALPPGAEIHHIDGNKLNNHPSNLVACQDHEYHALLHRRQRALEACGNPTWRSCPYCHRYDDPANMVRRKSKHDVRYHRACKNADSTRRAREARAEAKKAA